MAPQGAAARRPGQRGPRKPRPRPPTTPARSPRPPRPEGNPTPSASRRPRRRRAPAPMARGRVPSRDELLAFIKESPTPIGKREIARAFGIKGDQRIELKALLRDLRDNGEIAADRAKTFKDPKALTEITVLEIV